MMTGVAHSRPLTRADLCVTLGTLATLPDNRLSVTDSKMRAFALPSTSPAAELRFTYKGRSAKTAPLGSGQIRRQFGLKLRAQDSCNLVYAMWRIAPRPQLVVSIKRNPGQHIHAQCGTHGYRNVRPDRTTPAPVLRVGSTHSLRADMQGRTLRILIDGDETWLGDLGPQIQSIDGPIGVRSDNVRVDFEIDATITDAAVRACPAGPLNED
jgi:hypothetical protein